MKRINAQDRYRYYKHIILDLYVLIRDIEIDYLLYIPYEENGSVSLYKLSCGVSDSIRLPSFLCNKVIFAIAKT